MNRKTALFLGWTVAAASTGGVAILLVCSSPSTPRQALQLDVRIASPLDPPQRAMPATVGDRVVARGGGAEQLWVYRDLALVTRCSSSTRSPTCMVNARGVEVTFAIDAPGRYHVLAVVGAPGLVPAGDFDGDVLDVRARGGSLDLQSIRAVSQVLLPEPR